MPTGPRRLWLLLVAVLAVIYVMTYEDHARTPAEPTARNYCAAWRGVSSPVEDPRLRAVAMLENIDQLDGGKVDKACLRMQVASLVRWVNRLCAGKRALGEDVFASMFVSEARSRCP